MNRDTNFLWLEGVFDDAVRAGARQHALLRDELAVRAREHRASDAAVLALGVLAHLGCPLLVLVVHVLVHTFAHMKLDQELAPF